jgi:type IV fimbrial biogenesis protein FimT
MPLRSSAATRGFTFVEMMVTIAIVAIMMALAAPAMHQFVTQKAVSSSSDELVSALRFARSEALKRSSPVTVCAGNGKVTDADAACSTDWKQGWIVFADRDSDGKFTSGTDLLLRVEQPLSGQVSALVTDGAKGYTKFASTGIRIDLDTTSFTFKPNLKGTDANFDKYTRVVCVNAQGRVNVLSGKVTCS